MMLFEAGGKQIMYLEMKNGIEGGEGGEGYDGVMHTLGVHRNLLGNFRK